MHDIDYLVSEEMTPARKASQFQNVVIKANNAMHRLDEDDNVVINGQQASAEKMIKSSAVGTGYGPIIQGYSPIRDVQRVEGDLTKL